MAAPTPLAICKALATQIREQTGLRTSPRMLTNPSPPCGHVIPGPTDYDLAMGRGLDGRSYTVQIFVDVVSELSQDKLDAYLAPSGAISIKAAVEADRTLGGVVANARVSRDSGHRIYDIGGRAPVLGAEWTVEVLAAGQ